MGTWLYLYMTLALLDILMIQTLNEELDLLSPRQQIEYMFAIRGCMYISFVGAITATPLL